MPGTVTTKAELRQAAQAIVYEGLTITAAAERIGKTRQTLSSYIHHSDEWLEVTGEIIGTEQRQTLPVAWLRLCEKAKSGDLKAITEILDRLEGAVPHAITGKDGGPVQISWWQAVTQAASDDGAGEDTDTSDAD